MSNLYPDFPFVQRILEKRDKFWEFIAQVEYNLSCHVKSLPHFSFFFFNELALEKRGNSENS